MVWIQNTRFPGKTARAAALTPKMVKQRKVYTMGLGAAPVEINPDDYMAPSTEKERNMVQSWGEQYDKDPTFMPESTLKERMDGWNSWKAYKSGVKFSQSV